jgi:catechol 2,3-dioxygenase-like lactoylglutathione lyase family enzyme
MNIIRLHHAQITIPPGAEDEARRFYCGLLGLPEIPKPASLTGRGGFWVAVGDMQLHIGTEDGVERHATKAHLAYEVTEIAGWRETFAAHGIAILDGIPIPGYDRFEARDPFGNRIEFIAPRVAQRS